MLENIKNSNTLSRSFKLPILYRPEEVRDTIDIIYQIMTALAIGWNKKHFTHYDLHIDNIMKYDFISNKDYLKLFKIYKEDQGHEIPKIEKILFKYYIGDEIYIVPAKYLYVIIDYGFTYVDGMPAGTTNIVPRHRQWGCTSEAPNSSTDSYTFIVSVLYHIFQYKPYLIFDATGWIDNELTTFFRTFFDNYTNLYSRTPGEVEAALLATHQRNPENRSAAFKEAYINSIEAVYRFGPNHPQVKNSNFTYDAGHRPIFSSSQNIINWMRTTFYTEVFDENREDFFVFNWGDVPQGIIPGITPNEKIRRLIDTKLRAKQQKSAAVQGFMQTHGVI